ncbi:MAG: hypothetical protein JWO53_307, partial [Chlamydiia bacterium]|nr:hypothetical protein [Chlamydiia bacterium]
MNSIQSLCRYFGSINWGLGYTNHAQARSTKTSEIAAEHIGREKDPSVTVSGVTIQAQRLLPLPTDIVGIIVSFASD